jgi:hypothetical protein
MNCTSLWEIIGLVELVALDNVEIKMRPKFMEQSTQTRNFVTTLYYLKIFF